MRRNGLLKKIAAAGLAGILFFALFFIPNAKPVFASSPVSYSYVTIDKSKTFTGGTFYNYYKYPKLKGSSRGKKKINNILKKEGKAHVKMGGHSVSDFEEDINNHYANYGEKFDWINTATGKVAFNNGKIFSVRFYVEFSTGIGHEDGYGKTFNVKTGKPLKLTQAVSKKYSKYSKLRKTIYNKLLKKYGEEIAENFKDNYASKKKLKNANFYISKKGKVIVCFRTYDISDGAAGCLTVSLPSKYSAQSNAKSATTKKSVSKASLIKLKNGKVYKYDVNGDGKKDTIKVKRVKEYGHDGWYYESERDVYVNGKKVIKAWGYKQVNLWILKQGKQNIIIHQAVAGTGATDLYYYYLKKGKYKEMSVSSKKNGTHGYYFEQPAIVDNKLVIYFQPKYIWFGYVDSLKSFSEFGKAWSFDVVQQYKISNGKLVAATKYPGVSGDATFSSCSDFTTGKTLSSISKADGPEVETGDVVELKYVYIQNDEYCYYIKVGNQGGWFIGSPDIIMSKCSA